MTSKQRVFSHSTERNYNDYIKNKIGVEIFKNIKSNVDNNKECNYIKKFNNHNDLILLTKTYYNYINRSSYSLDATKDLYNSNNSYVDNKIIKDFDFDFDLKTDLAAASGGNRLDEMDNHHKKCKFYKECLDIPEVLYPYGVYYSNTPKIYFHFNLDLNKWCANKNLEDYNQLYKLKNEDLISINGFNNCLIDNSKDCYNIGGEPSLENKEIKKCKSGLCKNAKPLFFI